MTNCGSKNVTIPLTWDRRIWPRKCCHAGRRPE